MTARSATDKLHKAHGMCLMCIGAGVPLGEGVTWGAITATSILLLLRRRQIDWRILTTGPAARSHAALAIFFIAAFLAIGLSGHGPLGLREWGRWGPYLLLPVGCSSATCVDRCWLQRAAAAFIVSLTATALFGLVCYGSDMQPGEAVLRASALAAGQGRVPGSTHSAAAGIYFHRLKMAHVLLLGIAALWARQMMLTLPWRRRLGELAVLGVQSSCLLLTFTRGAALGAAVGALACLLAAPRRLRALTLPCVLLTLSGLIQLPGVRQRLASGQAQQATAVRGFIWSQAVRVIADHPLGVGLGNYPDVVGRYYDQIDPSFATRTYPHNILLAAWAEAGPVGLMAYAMVWLTLLAQCTQNLLRRGGAMAGTAETAPAHRAVAAAGLFGAVALWTVGMTHDVMYHNVVGQAYVGFSAWTFGMLWTPPLPLAKGIYDAPSVA